MAIVEGNKQNKSTGDVVNTRSKFPLSYEFFDTHRFGEYHPHFWFDGVEGDENVRLRSSHDVRSYTLKAPLLQDIQLKKDYFMVPMQAILPRNWEKWNAIPVNGDDVASDPTLDDVGCGVANFWYKSLIFIGSFYSAIVSYLAGSNRTSIRTIAGILRFFISGEYFFSSGSLMNSLGVRGNRYVYFTNTSAGITTNYSFDEFFDAFLSFLMDSSTNVNGFTFYTDVNSTVRYHVVFDGNLRTDTSAVDVDIHTALQIMRDNPYFQIVGLDNTPTSLITNIATFFNSYVPNSVNSVSLGDYNLSRLFAYQLICSHYYSNDHVDYIYSANLYRELIGNYVYNVNSKYDNFTYNGLIYEYDYCSSHYFDVVISYLTNQASNLLGGFQSDNQMINAFAYLSAIFGFKRSLRFLDYFTGTRTQPLAVGDVNIDVNTIAGNSVVSAVDVTKGISRQRLLNAVNRVGAKWENYIELMSGRKPAPDFHNPFYLGHTSDLIFGSESEYTGNVSDADSQNVTSVLRSNGGRYEFNIDFIDRPCIIIGVSYYDLPRVYGRAFERQTFIMNRYDMFNKYMQFVGDQPVDSLELGVIGQSSTTGVPVKSTFSYQNRDMQYKQRFNQLAGGFGVNSTQLDNWLYRADDVRTRHDVIDPDFIRSYNSEFDKFYLSLSGYSLGTYFHFIVRNINDSSASRPMAYAPSIL